PPAMRRVVLSFMQSPDMSADLSGRTQETPSANQYRHDVADLIAQYEQPGLLDPGRDTLLGPSEFVRLENKMCAVLTQLRDALPPRQFSQMLAAYSDAQQTLFDAGHIDRFIRATVWQQGLSGESDPEAAREAEASIAAQYIVVRYKTKEAGKDR